MPRRAILALVLALAAGCSRGADLFVEANARAHIGMLAGTIGSRPVGSSANERAREYIVDELRQAGLEVRVQEIDARRAELGMSARVANIIGVLPGERPEAVALVTHYDSRPYAPGAADAALGAGVAIEAARILASRPDRRWTLFVLVTDGEEAGLMGAAGLVSDPEIMERVHACINLDATGSRGTAVLFETGPGSASLVRTWARRAPHPRGGSYASEIYQRLPNDTDFSLFRDRAIPGLNFAPALDSYAYHTPRDTPDRLSRATIRTTGENVVTLVTALQDVDITTRSPGNLTFFDVGGTIGISYGAGTGALLSALALLLGVVSWIRSAGVVIRQDGALAWIGTFLWAWLGAATSAAAMVAATWLLRAAREVYHPWYAHPDRLFVLLIVVGATAAWSMGRLGQWLPARVHTARSPALAWSVALPAWIAVAGAALWYVPAAAYLWTVPLLSAGMLLSWLPLRHGLVVRAASLAVLAVAAAMWLRETHDVLRFTVALMGRQPIVTPAPAYALVIAAAGIMIVPPLTALLTPRRPLRQPSLVTAVLLLASAAAAGAAYVAPAYTTERPLRRHLRAFQDGPEMLWEIGSVEPGLDLGPAAQDGWMPARPPQPTSSPSSSPWERLPYPFVFRHEGVSLGAAPVAVSAFELKPAVGGLELRLAVVPREPALTVGFVLPPGVVPAQSSLPGRLRRGRWTASFVAVPLDGLAWDARFQNVTAETLRETAITVTADGIPGGEGWQRLPGWLPQERSVWTATATWVVAATSGPVIAPVPPLR